ncbi:MAG: ABC transporter permease [Oscillospiraceae bacterium]|nr:ABC transporter permease [Oscillospiraceae bacterium]
MENLSHILSADMLFMTLRLAIPIGLAAIGGTICERSGIVNLGLEGMMLMGAFGGVLGSHITGNPWLGIVFAVFIAGAMGLIHAVLCIHYRTSQTVSGVGINILAGGLTVVLTRAVWQVDGRSGAVERIPTVTIPGLSDIPALGALFTGQSPYVYLTVAIAVAAWFVFYKTKVGLRLRAIGDHPQAAAAAGVNVKRYRYAAVITSGMLCGLAGAYLSIVHSNMFINDMVAGRGFMALAANIFGGWNPIGSILASIVFAFAQAMRITLALDIPDQFIQMFPYILTLLVLIAAGRKARGPEALGRMED